MQELLRKIPSVQRVLQEPNLAGAIQRYSHPWVSREVACYLEALREKLKIPSGEIQEGELAPEAVAFAVSQRMESRGFRRVINGVGVILHTNLGRAPMASEALAAIEESARGYANLELALATGKRGHRFDHVEALLCQLTGAEAAMVVNNNAAAVFLALSAVAKGKEVIISRGQLVEIGGSFRIPDVMVQSGAQLVEVGTTNKTHLGDYRDAVTERTGLLLKVHTSNYRVIGFTAEVSLNELVELGRQSELPVMEDLGSGSLIDGTPWGLPPEPTVQEAVASGADLVTFSGDKLLGGPQGGIIVGRRKWVEQLKNHPLARALRVDKLTLAALESTLKLYLNPQEVTEKIPVWRMLTAKPEEIGERIEDFLANYGEELKSSYWWKVIDGFSQVGGGSLPEAQLPTRLLAFYPLRETPSQVEEALRSLRPHPIMIRIQQEALLIDFRTILAGEEEFLFRGLWEAGKGGDR